MTTLRELMAQGLLAQPKSNTLGGLLASPKPKTTLLGGALQSPNSLLVAQNDDEAQFQQWIKGTGWYNEFLKNYGEVPDLSPNADYDYRAAWRAGVVPERDPYDNNRYHWPSLNPQTGKPLKAPNHPTLWKEYFMRDTGVNPDAIGIRSPEEAEMWKRSQGR